MRITSTNPIAGDFVVSAQYRNGILRLILEVSDESDPLWLRAVSVRLERSDGLTEGFEFAIDAPIRMNPGGRRIEHWRPRAFELEDPAFGRPTIEFTVEASRRRRHPVQLTPAVIVDDGFDRSPDGYRLRPDSSFAIEIEQQKKRRLDGLTPREG